MVITETGAAKAVTKVIPSMDGKLTGNAIRVPTERLHGHSEPHSEERCNGRKRQ